MVEARGPLSLLPYLEDVDETVRFQTVEALIHARAHDKAEEGAREPLLKLLLSADEESRRIKLRILDGLCETGWNTHGYKAEVDAAIATLGGGYHQDGKGRIKKR